jgi:predicted amidophosphoribosyltransferase
MSNLCPSCHQQSSEPNTLRCPHCGAFYSSITALIEQIAQEEAVQNRNLWQRGLAASDKAAFLRQAFQQFKAQLTWQGKIALGLILALLFALLVVVL